MANEILSVSVDEIPHVLGSSKPTILDKADDLFAENTRRSVLSYALIGILAGIVIACGIVAVSVITNTSIKSDEAFKNSVCRFLVRFQLQRKKQKKLWAGYHLMHPSYLPVAYRNIQRQDVKTIVVTSAF
ncbi:MAG: hypothetical protein ACLR5J_10100 [Lachnospiraceae bacterium]